jgi:two-component system phosphate regulon response regulator OmpR
MMPGEDGLSPDAGAAETLTTPILLLTAKGEADDRITGWRPGPTTTCQTVRAQGTAAADQRDPAADAQPEEAQVVQVLHLGPIRYDMERGELWHGQARAPDRDRGALMRIFSGQPNQPFSRATWWACSTATRAATSEHVQERAVDVQITRLRKKIEVNPKQPRYLQTVRGAGYMLAPD